MIFLLERSNLLTFMIALSCVNSWLSTPVAAAEADARKNECLIAYSDAQEERMRGALLGAREQLLLCSSDDCPRPIQQDCSGWLRDVERDLSSVIFAVSDEAGHDLPSASVLVNGKPLADQSEGRAQLLDPGSYDYSVEAPGFARLDGTLVMRQSEKNRIVRVQLEKLGQVQPVASDEALGARSADSHFSIPTASIVLGATALVGVAGFAYFGLHGNATRVDADSCTTQCAALIDSGKRDYIIADISLGVAVAAAGTAIAIALLAPDDNSAAPAPKDKGNMHLAVGPTHVEWRLRF